MKSNKKEEKNSFIVLVIGIVIIFLIVFNLDNIGNLFLSNNEEEVVEEKKDVIPTRYQCFYGPTLDEFYNYVKSEYIIFDFDKDGNVIRVTSEEKYQATTSDDYNKMLTVLSINTDEVNYDEENYVVTIKSNSLDRFPKDYKSLNKYLSHNQYTCSKK